MLESWAQKKNAGGTQLVRQYLWGEWTANILGWDTPSDWSEIKMLPLSSFTLIHCCRWSNLTLSSLSVIVVSSLDMFDVVTYQLMSGYWHFKTAELDVIDIWDAESFLLYPPTNIYASLLVVIPVEYWGILVKLWFLWNCRSQDEILVKLCLLQKDPNILFKKGKVTYFILPGSGVWCETSNLFLFTEM